MPRDTVDTLLVAALGFNEAPIVRAIVKARPTKLLVVLPGAEGDAAAKLDTALNTVRSLAEMTGSKLETIVVRDPANIPETVHTVKTTVERLAGSGENARIYFALRGGLRLLTLTLLLAAQSLAATMGPGKALIIVEDAEGRLVELDASQLIPEKVGSEERKILRILAEKTLQGQAMSVRELAAEAGKPKSTVHKKLQQLIALGLAEQTGQGYTATLKGIITA